MKLYWHVRFEKKINFCWSNQRVTKNIVAQSSVQYWLIIIIVRSIDSKTQLTLICIINISDSVTWVKPVCEQRTTMELLISLKLSVFRICFKFRFAYGLFSSTLTFVNTLAFAFFILFIYSFRCTNEGRLGYQSGQIPNI